MFVVATGDAFNGMNLFGPFTLFNDAVDWGEMESEREYIIVEVESVDF